MPLALDMTPIQIAGVYTRFVSQVNEVLAPYFQEKDNPNPGPNVFYDIKTFWRDPAPVVSRYGDPVPAMHSRLSSVAFEAISLAQTIEANAQFIKDSRAPGEISLPYDDVRLADDLLQIRIAFGNRREIFRAQALGTTGGYLTFRAPGSGVINVDLGYTAASKLIHNGDWSDPTYTGILSDLALARKSTILRSGRVPTELFFNSSVDAMLVANTFLTKFYAPQTMERVLSQGSWDGMQLGRFTVHVHDYAYADGASPVAGEGTLYPYIPDNFVAMFPGDNANRSYINCEPASLHAPKGMHGFFGRVRQSEALNGSIFTEGEETSAPMVTWPLETTFDADVTADLDSARERALDDRPSGHIVTLQEREAGAEEQDRKSVV